MGRVSSLVESSAPAPGFVSWTSVSQTTINLPLSKTRLMRPWYQVWSSALTQSDVWQGRFSATWPLAHQSNRYKTAHGRPKLNDCRPLHRGPQSYHRLRTPAVLRYLSPTMCQVSGFRRTSRWRAWRTTTRAQDRNLPQPHAELLTLNELHIRNSEAAFAVILGQLDNR